MIVLGQKITAEIKRFTISPLWLCLGYKKQKIRATAETGALNKQREEKKKARDLVLISRCRMKSYTAHTGTEQEPGGSKMKMIEPSKSFTFMGHIIFYLASRILRSQNSEINQNHCLKVAQPPHSSRSRRHCLHCPCTLIKTLVVRPTWVVPSGGCQSWCFIKQVGWWLLYNLNTTCVLHLLKKNALKSTNEKQTCWNSTSL